MGRLEKRKEGKEEKSVRGSLQFGVVWGTGRITQITLEVLIDSNLFLLSPELS